MLPMIVRPEAASHISLYGVGFTYGIGAQASAGALSMLEVTIPARTLVKPHMHAHEDEYTLVLSGQVGARLGAQTDETLPAGSWLVKPRSLPHAIWNAADEPARILEVVVPGGLERYFEQVAPVLMGHGPESEGRYEQLAEAFGLTILDDWTDELEATYGISL